MSSIHDYINAHISFRSVQHEAKDLAIGEVNIGDKSVVVVDAPENKPYGYHTLDIEVLGTNTMIKPVICQEPDTQLVVMSIIAALARANRPEHPNAIVQCVESGIHDWRLQHATQRINRGEKRDGKSQAASDLRAHPLFNSTAHVVKRIPNAYRNVPGVILTGPVLTEDGIPTVYAIIEMDAWANIKVNINVASGMSI